MSATPDLIRRVEAATATVRRYKGKRFDFKAARTCVHMARFHLAAMGHKVPPMPKVNSLVSARRALDSRGWSDCAAMIDSLGFERIAPAQMLAGDLAFRASEDGLGGLLVALGPFKVFGWFGNEETEGRAVVMDMDCSQLEACWRV